MAVLMATRARNTMRSTLPIVLEDRSELSAIGRNIAVRLSVLQPAITFSQTALEIVGKFVPQPFLTYLIILLRITQYSIEAGPGEGKFKRSLWVTCAGGAGRQLQASTRGTGERDRQ